MECNICGSTKFKDMNGRNQVLCTSCLSLERTRLLWMYIDKLNISKNWKVLHLAPEKGIYDKLKNLVAPENYITADFLPETYTYVDECQKIDLTAMENWESERFDLILHSHVLEHIPCNIAYTLFHLHRILKKEGNHVCIIPFMKGKYDECFDDIGAEERVKRFGQADHVRKFGNLDINMHLGKILKLPQEFNALNSFNASELERYNIPKNHWNGFHIGTVLHLKKNDFLLAT